MKRGGGWKILYTGLKILTVAALVAAAATGVLAVVSGIAAIGFSASLGPTFSLFGAQGMPVITTALAGGAVVAGIAASAAGKQVENSQHDHTIQSVNEHTAQAAEELEEEIKRTVQEEITPLAETVEKVAGDVVKVGKSLKNLGDRMDFYHRDQIKAEREAANGKNAAEKQAAGVQV